MRLCNDFVEVHRRLAQLESLLPWEELPAPPAKRQCVTQVAVPEPIATARPPPEPAEGCGSQPPSAVSSAQGGRCSKGHLLKRAVVGGCKGLVCDGPCGRSLRSNMARWSCAKCDFDLCAARHPATLQYLLESVDTESCADAHTRNTETQLILGRLPCLCGVCDCVSAMADGAWRLWPLLI